MTTKTAPAKRSTQPKQDLEHVTQAFASRPSRSERYAMGEALRKACPRTSHAAWKPGARRPEPVSLVLETDKGRIPELVPIRHGRMLASPFAFYRGAARNMACDLAVTPATGLRVQACGDAHLANFGGYATPERRIVFDTNDLDETLPAPWEWDVKRLAASFVAAGRDNGLTESESRDAVMTCARSYRESMARFSEMTALEVWYSCITLEEIIAEIDSKKLRKRLEKRVAKEQARTALEYDFPKLSTMVGETPAIADKPPTIFHLAKADADEFAAVVHDTFARYRASLPDERRILLDRFEIKDFAMKAVGVGSVGTYCAVVLLMAGEGDPLFLQVKQARASVLEEYAGKSEYSNHGQRVVVGYRAMQTASDIFLGWTEGRAGRQFYVRQLRDAKISPRIENFHAKEMHLYAGWCGRALAHSHARTGDPAAISGYLGDNDTFDGALADFAKAYADQNERDYDSVRKAARKGKLEVVLEHR